MSFWNTDIVAQYFNYSLPDPSGQGPLLGCLLCSFHAHIFSFKGSTFFFIIVWDSLRICSSTQCFLWDRRFFFGGDTGWTIRELNKTCGKLYRRHLNQEFLLCGSSVGGVTVEHRPCLCWHTVYTCWRRNKQRRKDDECALAAAETPFKRGNTNKNKGELKTQWVSPLHQVSLRIPDLPWPRTEKAGPSLNSQPGWSSVCRT